MKKIEMVGKKFGKLLVISEAGRNGIGHVTWKCKCSCGKYVVVTGTKLRNGHTRSCGCLRLIGHRKTHGLTGSKRYSLWANIIDRCERKLNKHYYRYGGRGIKVCELWRNNPEVFVKWCHDNGHKEGLQIDRIDNDKGYSPENCRFVTNRENALNKTNLPSTNTTGFLGVYVKGKKYGAGVGCRGQKFYIGTFSTTEEAAQARDNYILDNFPEDNYLLNANIPQ